MSVTFGLWKTSHLDKKMLDKTIRELDTLSKFRGDPQFHRSHPYLPDIAQDMAEHLRQIIKQNLWNELNHNKYLQVTVQSLLFKTAQCSVFLKGGGGAFSSNGSSSRRDLTKMSLIFSHLLCELKALFPGGHFHGDSYKIVKSEASKFWTQKFGTRCVVLWNEFKAGLTTVHPVGEGPLESALRSTIDLTCNEHISVFEFDIFTRLFQPWDTLLQNWMLLAVTHPGYMAFQTYDEVRDHLQANINKPGSYIFRLSCTHLGQWAIGYVTSSGTILQTIPHNKSLFQALQEGQKEGLYLYPNGLSNNPDLSQLSNSPTNIVVHVTEEQWELYSDMDSTFELCKICADNEKNVRIQPCGHFMCDQCLSAWQKSDGLTCPFCRCVIAGKEDIQLVKDAAESTASNGFCSEDLGNFIDPEEEDWIRNRPLPPPPPPPSGNPSKSLTSPSSAPPIPAPRTHKVTNLTATAPPLPPLPSHPPLPPLPSHPPVPPRRMALHASDIINSNQQGQRLPGRISANNRTQRGQS